MHFSMYFIYCPSPGIYTTPQPRPISNFIGLPGPGRIGYSRPSYYPSPVDHWCCDDPDIINIGDSRKFHTYYCYLSKKIGKFPDMLKTGKITPIYKKEDEEQLENYRPISTLPIFGKIFEKLIYKRLYNFFVAQNLLHDKQFGFRKNHSTSHAINYSINHINKAIKTKNMF